MPKEEIIYVIERIKYLESVFDEVKNAFDTNPDFYKDESVCKKISLLTQYLESGKWLSDFELDEKGELPPDLKRGILSEDALYNFLCEAEKAKNKKSFNIFKKIAAIFTK